MIDHMDSKEVIRTYNSLAENGITTWIDGGWCIDALLGEQTREHPDLDIAVDHKKANMLKTLLEDWGFKEEIRSDTSDWNYAMRNDKKLIDVHVFEYDESGKNIYGIEYPYGSLTGTGKLDGQTVRCVSPEWMFKFKTAYEPKEKDLKDVHALATKFGFEIPQTHVSN